MGSRVKSSGRSLLGPPSTPRYSPPVLTTEWTHDGTDRRYFSQAARTGSESLVVLATGHPRHIPQPGPGAVADGASQSRGSAAADGLRRGDSAESRSLPAEPPPP